MPAVLQVLMVYLFLGASFLGWGRVVAPVVGVGGQRSFSWPERVWLGWAAVLVCLGFLHLVLPLAAYAVLPLLLLGVVFSALSLANALRQRMAGVLIRPRLVAGFTLVFLVVAWIALRSILLRPANYDSGLYHFTAVRWTFSYPIVPGLGNLHSRLAFNSSFFPFVAALNFYPFFGQGHVIANSFLLALAICTAVDGLRPVADEPALLVKSHPYRHGGGLLALPLLGFAALSPDLSSPTPDLTSSILQIALYVIVCRGISLWHEGHRNQEDRAVLVLVLAVTAVTVKLSNLGFSVGVAAITAAYWIAKMRTSPRDTARLLLPAGIIAITWSVRGLLLSGAPFFPSTIGYVSADWALPKDLVVEVSRWVYSWARMPGVPWRNVLGNGDWLAPWLGDMAAETLRVVYPLGLSAFLCLVVLAHALIRRRGLVAPAEWAILAPPAIGLVYWFLTAPDVRFANAQFFLLAVSSSLIFLVSVRRLASYPAYSALSLVVFVAVNLELLNYAVSNKWIFKPCAPVEVWVSCIPSATWQPVESPPVREHVTSSGLIVFTPTTVDQCWDAPLPCTPYFNDSLRLREPGNLASGFSVSQP